MAKISTYPLADTPLLLSDRLIGTEAIRNPSTPTPLATKNFSLGELLQLFSSSITINTDLQQVLDGGNTATQNINLTGTIASTLIKPVNIEDTSGSQGTTFQYLSKGALSISWVDLPVDNLQAVLNSGNSATQNITLVGNITSTKIIPTNIQDDAGGIGTTGQVLSKSASGIRWITNPILSPPGLGDVLSVGNTATNNITLVGNINVTNARVTGAIYDSNNSPGTAGQILSSTVTGTDWIDSSSTITPSPLTKVNDTNVTLTLGGTPATSLLESVSLTLGWTGTLADSRITSASVWNAKQAALSGTGLVKSVSGTISYIADNSINWDTAYTNRITSLTTTGTGAATLIANVLNIPTPSSSAFTSLTTTGSSGAASLTAGVLNVPEYTLAGLGGVPYTGATADVDLGGFDIKAIDATFQKIYLFDTAVSDYGQIYLNGEEFFIKNSPTQLLASVLPGGLTLLGYGPGGTKFADFTYTNLTADRTYALPNASGTIALTSDIPSLTGYVQNTRTLTINGTAYDLSADRSWSVGTVTSVGATSPITSSGGTTPTISTSMATNKLIGRSTAGTGVMEEITIGTGLTLSGGTLSAASTSGFVPYTGATADVDLGIYTLLSGKFLTGPSASANFTRFPNALSVISNIPSGVQHNESLYIGLMSEGTSVGNTWGSGVYGAGYTNSTGTGRGTGVTGEGHVSAAADTGVAVGVRGYAKDAHTGNYNIGLYGDAENGDAGLTYGGNISLFLANGNIVTSSAAAKTWYLGGNITFDGQGASKVIGVTNGASFALGTVTSGVWNATAIADAYIASAATWNAKQNAITLTVTGTSGAATLVGSTLNIPQYAVGIGGSGTTNKVPKFTSASTIGDSLIFDDGTNVGIGNTTPSAKLDVNGSIRGYGAGNAGRITSTDTSVGGSSITLNPQFSLGVPGIESVGAFPIAFNTNSSEKMRLTSAGDLGIGINTPSQKLHVAGNARVTGAIYDSANSAGTSGQVLSSTVTGTAWTTAGGGGTVTSVAALTLGTTGTDLSSSVANGTTTPVITLNVPTASASNRGALSSSDWSTFNGKFTLPSLTSGSVLFSNGTTIAQDNANFFWDDTNNRLGIGTASPDQKLAVEGNIRAGGVGNGFLLDTTGVNFTNGMKTVNNYETVVFSGRGSAGYVIAGDNDVRFGFGTTYTAGEKMRISSSGNVGIGISTPAKLLDVNGDALINGVTVGRGGGNINSNTAIGKDALSANTAGSFNTVLGLSAGITLTGSNNIFIGANAGSSATTANLSTVIGGFFDTTLNSFNESETLSVLKEDAGLNNYTGEISGLPHIWAPETKLIANSSTGTLISLEPLLYSAIFIEYNLEDTNGSARAGSIKAVWNSAASTIKVTEETTADIGSTGGCTIQFTLGGGFLNVELVNTNGYDVYCNTTSRILIRPTIQTL
jgi:hypothetical protein